MSYTDKHISPVNPTRSIYRRDDLPGNLLQNLDLRKELAERFSVFDVIRTVLSRDTSQFNHKQLCTDRISEKDDLYDTELRQEERLAGKIAWLAYAFPVIFPEISLRFYMDNIRLNQRLNSYITENSLDLFVGMDNVMEGDLKLIHLPRQHQVAGFYFRTPVRIWNEKGQRVYKIPPWEQREDLLKYLVEGNVNVYVLRRNLGPDRKPEKFELYVAFRGTSNDFNGIQQYGKRMRNTQVYREPMYSIEKDCFLKHPKSATPLFFYYYVSMIYNIWPHIFQALTWLDWPKAERIVVSGHSMGGALTTCFEYMLYQLHRPLWDKTFFRAFASPLFCNDEAVRVMEQRVIDSMQHNKHIEFINNDDMSNTQHLLGGADLIKDGITQGTSNLVSWLVEAHRKELIGLNQEDLMSRLLRIVQISPDSAANAFFIGVMRSQSGNQDENPLGPSRMGARGAEKKLYGHPVLHQTYNETLRICTCDRNIEWSGEYFGKSHLDYADLNFSTLWAPLRMYEDRLYRFYHKYGLKRHNSLRVIGLFGDQDEKMAEGLIKHYAPATKTHSPFLKHVREIIRLQTESVAFDPDTIRTRHSKKKPNHDTKRTHTKGRRSASTKQEKGQGK